MAHTRRTFSSGMSESGLEGQAACIGHPQSLGRIVQKRGIDSDIASLRSLVDLARLIAGRTRLCILQPLISGLPSLFFSLPAQIRTVRPLSGRLPVRQPVWHTGTLVRQGTDRQFPNVGLSLPDETLTAGLTLWAPWTNSPLHDGWRSSQSTHYEARARFWTHYFYNKMSLLCRNPVGWSHGWAARHNFQSPGKVQGS